MLVERTTTSLALHLRARSIRHWRCTCVPGLYVIGAALACTVYTSFLPRVGVREECAIEPPPPRLSQHRSEAAQGLRHG